MVVLKNCEPQLYYILAELFNMCLKEFCLPDCWNVSIGVPVFYSFWERSTSKSYRLVSLLSVVCEIFEKCVNKMIATLSPVFSTVSGLLVALQIFWQLYRIELLWLLLVIGILMIQHLIYPRHPTGFGILVFFANSSLIEFHV